VRLIGAPQRKLGRLVKYKVSEEEEQKMIEMIAEFQERQGLVDATQIAEVTATEKMTDSRQTKIRRVMRNMSAVLQEPGAALGSTPMPVDGQNGGTQGQVQDGSHEGTKKHMVELAVIQNVESLVPSKIEEELVQACWQSGKTGAQ
jgi:predicted ribonuclease YlaK